MRKAKIQYPCGKPKCFTFKNMSRLRPPHSIPCVILEILMRENVWVFSQNYIVEQIIQTHIYYKYMGKSNLNEVVRRALLKCPSYKKSKNFFKFIGNSKIEKDKEWDSDDTKLRTLVSASSSKENFVVKYIGLIRRTLEESPPTVATSFEIHKNLSKDSKFWISLSTIECVLVNSGENHFTKIVLRDNLTVWALKSNVDKTKVLTRCMKVVKAILNMSETGAGTKEEILKTLSKQCVYEMDINILEYVLEEYEGIYFRKAIVGEIVFWENI
ncbi:hypothetical protein ACFFRR_006617 [Megaselia abdita]